MFDAVTAERSTPDALNAGLYSSRCGKTNSPAKPSPWGAIGVVAHYSRDETIFSEGDEARYCYRVNSGAVRLSKAMVDGRRQISGFLLPGDLFAIDCGMEHSLTAEALSDAILTRYPRSHIERLGEDVAEVRHTIIACLRRELTTARHHLLMLGRQSAKERLASFLLLLSERRHGASGDRVDLPMSRQDIADYLGLTIETVCRTLAELKRLNVIATPERNCAVIRDIRALRAIAAGAH